MIFDAHGDILPDVYEQDKLGIDIWEDYHKDQYAKGGVKASILVNFTDPFSDNQEEVFNGINKIAPQYFKSREDINVVDKTWSKDKFNVILGIEGIKPLHSMSDIQDMYDLGYRHFGLTWNENNDFATSCINVGGLTYLGIELVEYANNNNVIIDLAHASKQTFMDVASKTNNPLFVSHSACRALRDHPRNLDDNQLKVLKETNGVVGIFNIRTFLSEDRDSVNLQTFVDHIEHVINVAGIDHVGLGLDFCFYLGDRNEPSKTKDLHTIADSKNIIKELERRHYKDVDIEKIMYGNMFRVVKETLKLGDN